VNCDAKHERFPPPPPPFSCYAHTLHYPDSTRDPAPPLFWALFPRIYSHTHCGRPTDSRWRAGVSGVGHSPDSPGGGFCHSHPVGPAHTTGFLLYLPTGFAPRVTRAHPPQLLHHHRAYFTAAAMQPPHLGLTHTPHPARHRRTFAATFCPVRDGHYRRTFSGGSVGTGHTLTTHRAGALRPSGLPRFLALLHTHLPTRWDFHV